MTPSLQVSRRDGELTVRIGQESDLPRILELMSVSLGTGSIPRSESYWNWKHRGTPFGESPVLLAEDVGQLVGLRVFMRWNWVLEKKRIQAVRAVDTATHPDWQGRGIFTRLTLALARQMEQEGIAFIFNTPNRSSGPGYLRMGWSSLGKPPVWVRPTKPSRLLWSLIRSERRSDQVIWLSIGKDYDLRSQLENEALDAILEFRLSRSEVLQTEMTREYLRWRYLENPAVRYHAAGSWSGDEQALVIFRRYDRWGCAELRLCEILVGPGKRSECAARRLIDELVTTTSPDFVTAMASKGSPESRVLSRSRFVKVIHGGPHMTLRPLAWATAGQDLGQWSRWRLGIGDIELF